MNETIIYVAIGLLALVVVGVLLTLRKKKPADAFITDPHERLKHALRKTRGGFMDALRRTLGAGELNEGVISSLEEILIAGDVGVDTTEKLIEGLEQAYKRGELKDQAGVLEHLKQQIKAQMGGEAPRLKKVADGPTVILVAGVNGAGKTTSIAKLTHMLAAEGNKVLLCASDTFRAAAVKQLKTWAERLNVEIVLGQQGGKPDAVAFDAHEKAKAKGFDYLIVDTAGRLHTDKNLMDELAKIARVGKKHIPDSPHEVLLVLDANTGQNAVNQAKAFTEVLPTTGIFLAKLDGTAKGAFVVQIRDKLGVPVKFVGLGEQPTDIARFDADKFVDALFGA